MSSTRSSIVVQMRRRSASTAGGRGAADAVDISPPALRRSLGRESSRCRGATTPVAEVCPAATIEAGRPANTVAAHAPDGGGPGFGRRRRGDAPSRMGDLRVEGVTVRFGGLTALEDVSLGVGAGEVVGVIGPNGAGKTTLFNVICGFLAARRGDGHAGAASRCARAPARARRAGIARTLQGVDLFAHLTVRENVMVGAERFARAGLASALLGLPRSDRDERRAARGRARRARRAGRRRARRPAARRAAVRDPEARRARPRARRAAGAAAARRAGGRPRRGRHGASSGS